MKPQETGKDEKNNPDIQEHDLDKFIEQQQKLENLLEEKFTRIITVMFTDLKGSTSIADALGDIASRTLMKQHNDILFPIIEKNQGVLVKTMGDGTLSYFKNPQDAVRAAVQAQINFDKYNTEKKPKNLILVSIGLHTGKGVVEKKDVFGDVVNVAARIQTQASPGEICLSEEAYNQLTNKTEIYCRYIKTAQLKGKQQPFRIYKAFWDEKEVEKDKYDLVHKKETIIVKKRSPLLMAATISAPFVVASILMANGVIPNLFSYFIADKADKRSLEHSVSGITNKTKPSEYPITIIMDNE